MKIKVDHPELDPDSAPEIKKLAGQVGEFIEYWGFKSVQGRLWCYLWLSREPLSSIDFAQLLEISPALVTQSLQVLLKYELILPVDKGVNGILRFRANANVASVIAGVLEAREAVLLDKIQASAIDAQDISGKNSPFDIDRQRLKQIAQWTKIAKFTLRAGIRFFRSSNNVFNCPEKFGNLTAIIGAFKTSSKA